MSECVDDPVAFEKLTDNVLHRILWSTDPNLAESRDILNRVFTRQLYKCVGQATPQREKTYDKRVGKLT